MIGWQTVTYILSTVLEGVTNSKFNIKSNTICGGSLLHAFAPPRSRNPRWIERHYLLWFAQLIKVLSVKDKVALLYSLYILINNSSDLNKVTYNNACQSTRRIDFGRNLNTIKWMLLNPISFTFLHFTWTTTTPITLINHSTGTRVKLQLPIPSILRERD